MGFADFFKNFAKEKEKENSKGADSASCWVKCPHCNELMYYKEVIAQNRVCPKCNFHMKVDLQERIAMLCDEGSLVEYDKDLTPTDPIAFVDKKSYEKRVEEGMEKCGRPSSVLAGECRINNVPAQIVIFDFNFMGGSLGSVEGEKIVRAINRAIARKHGLVIVSTSGGARMQESTYSLMQMAKSSAALAKLSAHKLPYISILTDPTLGGVSASFAFLGDIIIAEPGATVGFAGARVIKQTISVDLPEGFQKAEFLLEHGLIDMIAHRKDLKGRVSALLKFLNQHDQNTTLLHL
ncbi:acetyl-CoA carboxylase, carboxyltransferase subunit beta [Helicobacter monodelphidis]|uniref:acetyl-CoA carboxylase, carboxyltransferase subunit beta n=1 Tax=Helicobacter sp. 15-1451 TaxID=2004995 RepID=UPI000DCD5AB4|nr:acetyl-CoA carboxylase, carboxyltransferase subunit beta [Helicobacter sp. 15-1451]RAX58583.1 acetyl-CoA carboxylase, carboxyltransferase subunit beta [Helicobacter sp. 15-1451]